MLAMHHHDLNACEAPARALISARSMQRDMTKTVDNAYGIASKEIPYFMYYSPQYDRGLLRPPRTNASKAQAQDPAGIVGMVLCAAMLGRIKISSACSTSQLVHLPASHCWLSIFACSCRMVSRTPLPFGSEISGLSPLPMTKTLVNLHAPV